MRLSAPALVILLLTAALAGCVSVPGGLDEQSLPDDAAGAALETTRGWSQPLSPALYEMLPGVEVRVPSFDDTPISLGIFRPDIPGCDWEAEELPEECQIPVVMDAGPYWGAAVDQEGFRPPLNEWLVPRGYAVVHMSIRGTGESGGCMEFMSTAEQRDVSEMVTWLAEQPWSNGNVGMMGRSYDGTTPFMAAALGNPHLKTIVPISGVASVPDLMFKNGTSEGRGPYMHSVVYWALFGVGAIYGPDAADFRADHWSEQACEEFAKGTAEGPLTAATGDASSRYWQERDFQDRITENFNGSVWIIHGMEDWNVNPSQVVPWINELQDAGVPTRAWLGQWAHAYPDRVDEHRNVRWDWAQETVEWFDYYLKEEGEQPPLNVEVEDSLYTWRVEESYPPRDVEWVELELGSDGTIEEDGAEGGFVSIPGATLGISTEPLEEDLRIVGLPQLHLTVTPTRAEGGYLFAELYDVFPDGRTLRIGWAAMNLRFHHGGNTDPATLVPGEPVVAKMQFEPMDAHVAKGHELQLRIHQNGVEDVLESPYPQPIPISAGGDSVLRLSTVDRPAGLDGYAAPGLGGE